MRRVKKVLAVLLMVSCLLVSGITVSARAAVTKVTDVNNYKNGKQSMVIYGKTRTGKNVWKYKSKSYTATELSAVSYKVWKNRVYIVEGKTLTILNKQTGKALLKRKRVFSQNMGSAVMYIDKGGNLYTTGYYGDVIYKISPKGKVLWKRTVSSSCYWPTKIRISGNRLVVYYDGYRAPDAVLNKKSGKLINYRR
ncbi:MAG TPA: PQQ-binding-like beta-propeller repeat protein [Candidatus Limivivens merdigallinarum]|uniref:PQQ-binding-like beta-propeller repeat protein n=1 Tax=Candidatus Limivivens merdigallinarum TaxID=2840859 RepID=A0A9D1D223_9FIRM|nr:PQQ-binding-like beta-propeller repeat protein [Candidatus Limivivens merdigallinarum]